MTEKDVIYNGRRILLFGSANSRYILQYVKKMHSENRVVTLINDSPAMADDKKEFYKYYKNNNVNIITIRDENLYIRCLKCAAEINLLEDFDICHIMLVSPFACLTVKMCENKFKFIAANFFGSDFYRASVKMMNEQKMLLDTADSIVIPTDKMKPELIKRWPEFESKIHTVYFESSVFNILRENIENSISSEESKVQLSEDKIVIAAGYNGYRQQQHSMFIKALNNCSREVKDKVVVIFMMTYGMTEDYKKQIQMMLNKAEFEYIIIQTYINDEQMALLRKRIDIFVNAITTDAFNAAIQESLFCQSVIMCGDWLDYPQLKAQNANIIYFKDMYELSDKIEQVILNIGTYKREALINRQVIEKINKQRGHVEDWGFLYDDIKFNHNVKNDGIFLYLADNAKIVENRNCMYRRVMEMWLRKKIKSETPIVLYLTEHKFNNITIYGAGTLGEMVYEEIKYMDINIDLCDVNLENAVWFDGKILKPQDLSDKKMDCIIVTPIHIYDEIKGQLKGKADTENIVSLIDIL
ncbi:MAG: glycosyltransferase [Lachnospiraceae bacterium]|nr:glycosyltransferase [Lachnospiraceae bacterium]